MKRHIFWSVGLIACGLSVGLVPPAFGQRAAVRSGAPAQPAVLVNRTAARNINPFLMRHLNTRPAVLNTRPFVLHQRVINNALVNNAQQQRVINNALVHNVQHHHLVNPYANAYASYLSRYPHTLAMSYGAYGYGGYGSYGGYGDYGGYGGGYGGYGGSSGGYGGGYGGGGSYGGGGGYSGGSYGGGYGSSSGGNYGSSGNPTMLYYYQSPAGSIDPITPATYGGAYGDYGGSYAGGGSKTADYYQTPYGSANYGNNYGEKIGISPTLTKPGYDNNSYGKYPAAQKQVVPARHALVTLKVPSSYAEVWFDGEKIDTTGTTRVYQTPDLPAGKDVTFVVRVVWAQKSQVASRERTVTVSAGQTAVVDFTK
jgi:uncharacterized protein (TIGR03000 family)